MSKKILIVSSVFYPVNSPRANRATELAKQFARDGHNVTVLTPRNENYHNEFESKHNIVIKDLGKPKWKPAEIKGSGIGLLARRAVVRFSKLLFEYPTIEFMGLVKKALKKEKTHYDLLISIAVPYPVHWGVAKVRSKKNKIADVWVADCGDPFMGKENDTFKSPFYFKYVEKWFCKKTDYLTVPTQGSINAYYPEFRDKIKVISQGFDFNEIKLPEGPVNNSVPNFCYPGLFIKDRRDPKELLVYLSGLKKDFRFYIYTNKRELVDPYIKKTDERFIVANYIPREELIVKLASMDFLVNFDYPHGTQTPSKLIDFAMVKRPVLSVITNKLNKQAVDEFLEGNYTKQYMVKDVDQYRIENVCAKFLSLTD